MSDIPVVALIGWSGSGKTTFMEKLIPRLKARGLRVAVIKHDGHDFDMDREGKDTWRFAAAGADAVAIASPRKAALIEYRPLSLDEMIERISGVDLILIEGYKATGRPKIELRLARTGKPPYERGEKLLALITDGEPDAAAPSFTHDEAEGVAELICQRILQN